MNVVIPNMPFVLQSTVVEFTLVTTAISFQKGVLQSSSFALPLELNNPNIFLNVKEVFLNFFFLSGLQHDTFDVIEVMA